MTPEAPNPVQQAIDNAGLFSAMLRSVHEFSKLEVKPVMDGLLRPTDDDSCYLAVFYRSLNNVETLLTLNHVAHFQAIAMLSRAVFELAVDIRLLEEMKESGCLRMRIFVDVEKLRSARKVTEFKSKHPDAEVDTSAYEIFITTNQSRIDHNREILWPGVKRLNHWSALHLSERVKKLGQPFEQIYNVEYPRLSWYVHSGLTGVLNIQQRTYAYLCSSAFQLACDSYGETMRVLFRRYKLHAANPKIELMLATSKKFPFTQNDEEVAALTRQIQD